MPTPDHLQNPDTPEIIITHDDDKIADILARQSYKSEDNPHVGYSQTISDGGERGKEHLIRNIFYDDKPVGFATATLSTGEGNLFALLADNAYIHSLALYPFASLYVLCAVLLTNDKVLVKCIERHECATDTEHAEQRHTVSPPRTYRSENELFGNH